MKKIKACIFDLDGVIVDTAKYHYVAWKRLAREMGFDLTEEENEQLKGVSRMASLDILLKLGNKIMDEKSKLDLADRKNAWYREYIKSMQPGEIYPGAVEFIKKMKSMGYKLAIGSASKNAPTILEQLNIIGLFDAVVDGNKISKAKPDPQIFLMAAEELNTAPEYCVVFEDALAGVEAALNAGMYCVGIGSPAIPGKAHLVVSGLHEMKPEMLNF